MMTEIRWYVADQTKAGIKAIEVSPEPCYPTGDVVVSERDLAEQLRKPHNAVATALNLLLSEEKVQRAPLRGYWKLNL